MKHNFKNLNIFLIVLLISIIFLSSPAKASESSTITDPAYDVGEVNTSVGPSGSTVTTYQTVSDHADIDITSASYNYDSNGSITFMLTVRGSIETNNLTYYEIDIVTNTTTTYYFELSFYYSSSVSVERIITSIPPNVEYLYTNSSGNGFGSMISYVNGSTITFTLGTNITTESNTNFNVTYPTTFEDSWQWHIIAHQGKISDAYGVQYWDFYPNSDNKYTTDSAPSPTPGFEFFSLLSLPVLVIILKKSKLFKKF